MCKPCVGAKLVLCFQALITHAFLDRSITIFVPQIGMYIRINMSKTDFFYCTIWYDSVTFCQRWLFFILALYIKNILISIEWIFFHAWNSVGLAQGQHLVTDHLGKLVCVWQHLNLYIAYHRAWGYNNVHYKNVVPALQDPQNPAPCSTSTRRYIFHCEHLF